ncbi:T-cell surface glycoprotein CD3 epsilon chain [Varanus komodoensis]|uniref:T-cell surface glycoprotein CD3 epsilon chain n=1 Tax=Varanus komodoensis TaxID=61221 RepID=UPI001CF7B23D|nr:T-cell surface glycoprotein CD3 epsilon chain [Varanus komodoensis]
MRSAAGLGALAALLLCFRSPVRGQTEDPGPIGVDISGKSVTLICPLKESSWEQQKSTNGKHFTIEEDKLLEIEKGKEYTCKGSEGTRRIFLKAKVCADCVELGMGLVAGIVAADLLITLGVLLLVYYCRRSRAASLGGGAARGGARGRPRGPKADRPPPVPNPDYEPIRKGQREVYAGLEPKAF